MIADGLTHLSENKAVNHEFINSLASVRSLSELLVEHPALNDADRIRFLKIIRDETERQMQLLTQLSPASKSTEAP